MLIREVILENFMSYEYARVPLKQGVNVVCGPNGAGKSSFLLGICVALGETYTERSKRLSDLIRWGKDTARISLHLDNSVRGNGFRPVPQFNMDTIRLTRNLRRDGKYWFQLNQKNAQKYEVMGILKSLGFDSDNMLIVMHQSMPEQFAYVSSSEKLKTLEEAVGYQSFRSDVLEAKKKLSGILSEEESLNQLLGRARETLNHWREQNERLKEKRQLQTRSLFLQREMAWSRVRELETTLSQLEQEIDQADSALHDSGEEMAHYAKLVIEAENSIKKHRSEWSALLDKRIGCERTVGVCRYAISNAQERLAQVERLLRSSNANLRRFEVEVEAFHAKLNTGPTTLDDYFRLFSNIEKTQSEAYNTWHSEMDAQKIEAEKHIISLTKELGEGEAEATAIAGEMDSINVRINEANENYIEGRIRIELLKDRRERMREKIEQLKGEIGRYRKEFDAAEAEALIRGTRVETGRKPDEILGEMRKVSGILLGLADVSDEVEAMFESYSQTFKELQERVEQVRVSRRKVMEEVEERTTRWLKVTRDLIEVINGHYKSLLTQLFASGEVRLVNSPNIEEAGLDLYVGYNGARESRLDPYTHSGGERSTAVMAFLLALQQNVLSPFRAIDEFDLHMDPKNREIVSDFIVSTLQGSKDQYMVITPSQVTFRERDVHLIMVHKTGGMSTVRMVE